jgi:peptidoglycan L-alanyl-D-glutamate endopeptidase CwlK
MGYELGQNSADKLKDCHIDLGRIVTFALQLSEIDFGIAEGHRSVERQQQLFKEGKSQIDGITKKGKHNYNPSLAIDIFVYHPDKNTRTKLAYDVSHLCYIAGIMQSAAKILKSQGRISHDLRWGGNWNGDGVLLYDQGFDDLVHFELV